MLRGRIPFTSLRPAVSSNASRLIARLLWFFPLVLLALSVHQVWVFQQVRDTLRLGVPGKATITDSFSTRRVEVSYDYVNVNVRLADGRTFSRRELPVNHTYYQELTGKPEVDVVARPGAPQEIVFTDFGHAHWRLALINAVMSFLGALMLGGGIYAWSRMLRTQGDPALRSAETAA